MDVKSQIIAGGNDHDEVKGKSVKTVNPPIYQGSTVLFDDYADLQDANSGIYPGVTYGTDRMPNQRCFEEALCALEGGFLCRSFQSGISAISHVLYAFLKSGDHILVCENVYGPTASFCRRILKKYDIDTTFVPGTVGANISTHIRHNTKLIFLESPGSNTFEIQDIPAITGIARKLGIVTVLDNTWATPLYLRPFDLGVDVSIQSVTKYLSGHSDLLFGAATVNERYAEILASYYQTLELFVSPQDAALALRGLKTLAIRLKQHESSALEIARSLEPHEKVDSVIHPALPSHPQHDLWRRDFSGSSGLFAFVLKGQYPDEKIAAFVDSLELFGLGYSWGGYKSLVTVGRYDRSDSRIAGKTLVRLNIGLEDSADLLNDLQRGLRCLD